MKKRLLLLTTLAPLFANAQTTDGFNLAAFIGVILAIGLIILLFLALRQLVLWYWKIDKIVAYQEQTIAALHSMYNSQEELLKVAKAQQDTLKEISTQFARDGRLGL